MIFRHGIKPSDALEVIEVLLKLLTSKGIRVIRSTRACTNGVDTVELPELPYNSTERDQVKFLGYGTHEGSHFEAGSDPKLMSRKKLQHACQNAVDDIRSESVQEKKRKGIIVWRREWYKVFFEDELQDKFPKQTMKQLSEFLHKIICYLIFKVRSEQLGITLPLNPSDELKAAYDKHVADLEPQVKACKTFGDALKVGDLLHERLWKILKEEEAKRFPEPKKPEKPTKPERKEKGEPSESGEPEEGPDGSDGEPEEDKDGSKGKPGKKSKSGKKSKADSSDEDAGEGDKEDAHDSGSSGKDTREDGEQADTEGDGKAGSDESEKDGDTEEISEGSPDDEGGADEDPDIHGEEDTVGEDDDDKGSTSSSEDTEDASDKEEVDAYRKALEEYEKAAEEYKDECKDREAKIKEATDRKMDEVEASPDDFKMLIEKWAEEINREVAERSGPYMVAKGVRDIIAYAPEQDLGYAEGVKKVGIQMLGTKGDSMTRLFVSQTRERTIYNQRSGHFDMMTFMQDATDSRMDIYTEEIPGCLEKAAVSFMMDNSSSMGCSIGTAYSILSGFLYYLCRAAIPCEAVGFTADTENRNYIRTVPVYLQIVKKFEDPYDSRVIRRCVPPDHMDQNAEVDCLRWMVPRLLRRKEGKKILFIVGDGQPCIGNGIINMKLSYAYKGYLELCRQAGIVVFGFGIRCDLSEYFKEDFISVDTSDIGDVVLKKLTEILNRKRIV